VHVVFNADARQADDEHAVVQACKTRGYQLHRPQAAADVARAVAAARSAGAERLIAAGGDGTINAVLNHLAPDFDLTLGVLPLGTGNDLARLLGVAELPLREALEIAAAAPPAPVDVVAAHTANDPSRYFVNVTYAGFGGSVGEALDPETKQTFGRVAFWLESLRRVLNLPTYDVALRLAADDEPLRLTLHGLFLANGVYLGGGVPVARDASPSDGRLEIILAPAAPLTDQLAAAVDLVSGRYEASEQLIALQAQRVEISAMPELPYVLDGESVSLRAPTFEVLSRRLGLVFPPGHAPAEAGA
jgi:YegS/Rv2252/BmrU family lipid kinase